MTPHKLQWGDSLVYHPSPNRDTSPGLSTGFKVSRSLLIFWGWGDRIPHLEWRRDPPKMWQKATEMTGRWEGP